MRVLYTGEVSIGSQGLNRVLTKFVLETNM